MREKFQSGWKNLEVFVLEVMNGERRDFRANVMRGFLFVGSKVFHAGVNIRRWLYNCRG